MAGMRQASFRIAMLSVALIISGCASSPPDDVDNVCEIFRRSLGGTKDAKKSRARWDAPISVMMAIMHQESRFVATAKPPRKKIWGVIPGPRPSDAYGYSQAKDDTWTWYERSSGNYGADQDDFGDAIDFIGWYNDMSYRQNRIAKDDTFRLYLAYHEGHGGYEHKPTVTNNGWSMWQRKVDRKAQTYNAQLKSCVKELEEDDGWWPF